MLRAQDVQAEHYLSPETLAQITPFELRAKMIVEGVMSGMHRSPYQGMAVEFAEHREYVAGDDLKHLDWKVYGRSDKLYVKRYQQETNLDVIVVVDSSTSMDYGSAAGRSGRWTKFDHATALAAAIAFICLRQQDRVGLALFDAELGTVVERSGVRGQWKRIVAALAAPPATEATDLGRSTDQLLSSVGNRALFVLISDFFSDADAVRRAMAQFRHRRHDVIMLQTLDRQEMRFAFGQAAPFQGMEREGSLHIEPRALREAYLEVIGDHCAILRKTARAFGFDYQLLDTHQSLGPPLAHLLWRHLAMIKRGGVR